MAQKILTPDMITREGLRILHEKLNFVGTINRQYDDSFAKSGAKIGDALRIRKPAQYTVRSGDAISVQAHVEQSTTLTVDQKLGVDVAFSSDELTLDLDDFSSRVLEPRMAALASAVEENVLTKAQAAVGTVIDGKTFADFNKARAYLNNQAAPQDNNRSVLINPLTAATLVDALKGLFQASDNISKQYKEGKMGTTAGFTWYENSRIPSITLPADVTGLTIASIGAADADTGLITTIAISGVTATEVIPAGTAFTVDVAATGSTIKAVHPETKKTYSYEYTFVTQADVTVAAGGLATLTVHPFSATGATQNISRIPAATDVLTVLGGVGSAVLEQDLAYHKDFFTVAFADLRVPKGVDMASSDNYDGVAMRFVQDYNISDDKFYSRFDVLFGSGGLRPELGVKLV